jgi:DNA-directed RNA polymerase beta subunit
LEEEGAGASAAMGLASQLGIDIGGTSSGGAFKGANVLEIFKSRLMIQKALLEPVSLENNKQSLAELYIEANEWRKAWKKKANLRKLEFPVHASQLTRTQDSILGLIYEKLIKSELTVGQKDKKNSIINVDVKSKDELFAKQFTETLAVIVSDFYVETKSKKAKQNLAILERQRDSIRVALNSSLTGVAVSNDEVFGLNPALNVRRVPGIKKEVDVQANSAILTELVKQTELARINLRKETPLIQVIDKPILPLKKEKFGKLKGLVIGGLLAAFLVTGLLIGRKLLKGVMSEL